MSVVLVVVSVLLWLASDDLYQQAANSFQQGSFEDALKALARLPEQERSRPAAQNLRSLALMKLHQTEAALAASAEAVRSDPGNPNYLYNRGLIQLEALRFPDAENTFRQAIGRFPQSSRLYQGLGETLFKMNRFDQAEQALKIAVKLDPTSGEAQAALAKLYYALGDQQQFAAAASMAIRLDPRNYLACYFYGKYQLEQAGRAAEGRDYIARSVQLSPQFEDALIDWGQILSREGRWKEAADAYERAAKSNPGRAQTYYLMYTAYRKSGNSDQADRALQQYQALNQPKEH
jgi:tetratricopeptide (TPR) repeat protein